MAKKKAPVKLTSGSGFDYEDYVAGRLLLDLLRGIYTFGPEFGRIVRLDWQGRDTERLLEDLIVTLETTSGQHIAECSIKSDKQVTESGFPEHFVESVWEEWFHVHSDEFRRDADLLVLVTGDVANGVYSAWHKTLRESTQTAPERMVARLTPPDDPSVGALSSEMQRVQFESLSCPASLKKHGNADATVTAVVLNRIRLLTFDYESDPSRDESRALLDCQSALASGDQVKAGELWVQLLNVAKEKRTAGGTIDLPELIASLREQFELNEYPDYRADFKSLDRISRDVLEDIRSNIGSESLDRADEVDAVETDLRENKLCLIMGESGSGKSAISKFVAQQRYDRVVAVPFQAAESGHREDFQRNLHITHQLIDLLRASRDQCLLLFDSIERYSSESIRLVGRIISEILADEKCMHVSVLLISQFEFAHRVISNLMDVGLTRDRIRVQQIDCPDEVAIDRLVRNVHHISYFTLRKELRSLLRNLKILDWVVKAAAAGSTVSNTNVTGIVALIEYLWNRWIEAGDMTIARSGLLKRIATREADTLTSGVRLSELDHSEHGSVPAMVTADLLKVRDERVRFSHDLLGDWARLRVLIEQDPTTTTEGLARAALPRWHRAVRLFGKWLIESDDGIRRWNDAMTRACNDSSDSDVVRDLILEAVLLDDDAGQKLDDAWPTLVENNGVLLGRLLDRFLFVATIPDPRIQNVNIEGRAAEYAAVAFRIPFWPQWPPLLQGLHKHLHDVVRLAPLEVAKICRLWLEKMPRELSTGTAFPWRKEAAELAYAIAREVQGQVSEGMYFAHDEDRIVYEAALFAAPDLPDQVATLSLELACRRPPSPEITARAEAARERREDAISRRNRDKSNSKQKRSGLPLGPLSRGTQGEPWPNGPTGRVPSSFRSAVLDSGAWLALLAARLDLAVEVLVAVCIEAREDSISFGFDCEPLHDRYGLVDWREGHPPMYFRGPFLQFFRQAPNEALKFATELVNFATERWANSQNVYARRNDRPVPSDDQLSLFIPLAHGEKRWFGDGNVYRWHSDAYSNTNILPSVLMALEKYLYEQLEKGADIAAEVQAIMERSQSLAFAALMIDVGKQNPSLFLKELRPLLGVSIFYYWDREFIFHRQTFNAALVGWVREPRTIQDLARSWYSLQHRSRLLIYVAQDLMHTSAELADFFTTRITEWKAEMERPGKIETAPSFFPQLIAVLDSTNYQVTTTEGGTRQVQYQPPESLEQRRREGNEAAENEMLLIVFPSTCRRILDGEEGLGIGQLNDFWETIQKLVGLDSDEEGRPGIKENAVVGGIAVLLCNNRKWLQMAPEKESWCLEYLRNIHASPPANHEFDTAISGVGWEWEYFLAECGVALACEDPSDVFSLRLIAEGITSWHYGVTKVTTKRVFSNASVLRGLLTPVQILAIRWSVVRMMLARSQQLWTQARELQGTVLQEMHELPDPDTVEPIAQRWASEYGEIVEQFVAGTVSPIRLEDARRQALSGFEELESLTPEKRPRHINSRFHQSRRTTVYRDRNNVDLHVIQAAFDWISSYHAPPDFAECELNQLIKELQALSLGTIPVPTDYFSDELDGLPDDFDRWIFGLTSIAIATLGESDSSDVLWQPILDLGPYGHYFIESFFTQWFIEGLLASAPAIFVDRWMRMIRYALSSSHWNTSNPAFYRIDSMAFELMGYQFGEPMAIDETFAPLLEEHVITLAQVADRWFIHPRVLNGFVRNITKPAYQRILCKGIEWIHAAVAKLTSHDFRHERDFESNVVHALRCCWERHKDRVAADTSLRLALSGLLAHLASAGSHEAMYLRDQMVNSLSMDN